MPKNILKRLGARSGESTIRAGHLLRLRRADGHVYLDRWGIGTSLVGIYLHRMEAPDPGEDLHDHPWPFVSVVLTGGYVEERAPVAAAAVYARLADRYPDASRGLAGQRNAWTIRKLGLGECHRITHLLAPRVWTLVLRGPRRTDRLFARSDWGFYLPSGWVDERTYDETVRPERRDLWNEKWQEIG